MIWQDQVDPDNPSFKICGIPWKDLPDKIGLLPLYLYGSYCRLLRCYLPFKGASKRLSTQFGAVGFMQEAEGGVEPATPEPSDPGDPETHPWLSPAKANRRYSS